MKQNPGSSDKESSPDSPSTSTTPYFFFSEWVVGVFFGGMWHQVKPGTLKKVDVMNVFQDPYDDNLIYVLEKIAAYRVEKPEL